MTDQYDKICKEEFKDIHDKLDSIDVSLRGNGKPGIITRLDRLEQTKLFISKLLNIKNIAMSVI